MWGESRHWGLRNRDPLTPAIIHTISVARPLGRFLKFHFKLLARNCNWVSRWQDMRGPSSVTNLHETWLSGVSLDQITDLRPSPVRILCHFHVCVCVTVSLLAYPFVNCYIFARVNVFSRAEPLPNACVSVSECKLRSFWLTFFHFSLPRPNIFTSPGSCVGHVGH